MTVVLQQRRDLTTMNYLRVAWRGEPVELAEAALRRMADTRKAFLALLEGDPDSVVDYFTACTYSDDWLVGQVSQFGRTRPVS